MGQVTSLFKRDEELDKRNYRPVTLPEQKIRLRNLICSATKLKLYNAFILPHF